MFPSLLSPSMFARTPYILMTERPPSINQLIDWPIDWSINQSIDWLINRSSDQPNNQLIMTTAPSGLRTTSCAGSGSVHSATSRVRGHRVSAPSAADPSSRPDTPRSASPGSWERRSPHRSGDIRSEPSSCVSVTSCGGWGQTGWLPCSYRAYSGTRGYLRVKDYSVNILKEI